MFSWKQEIPGLQPPHKVRVDPLPGMDRLLERFEGPTRKRWDKLNIGLHFGLPPSSPGNRPDQQPRQHILRAQSSESWRILAEISWLE